jgi:DNA polymerase I-like protein with 3'-5' exonuclease and polymerase domains
LWSSPSQLSAVLYGGTIKEEYKEEYEYTYKDGHVAKKLRNAVRELHFPQLVKPLPNTKNNNGYSTDEGTLKKLKSSGKAKQIISLLLRKRELDKAVGTYYHGLPKLIQEKGWEGNLIHGQLSHCRAATGRLSSKEPNQQNLDYGVRECIITRFPLAPSSVST